MNNNVVARLTVVRQNGMRTIVEVHADATFHRFYSFYCQQGLKRSTKTFTRSGSRNEALTHGIAHRQTPGLDPVAKQLQSIMSTTNPVIKTTLRIIKKRAYKKLIQAAPDALGLTKVNVGFTAEPAHLRQPIGILFTSKLKKLNHHKLHAGSTR